MGGEVLEEALPEDSLEGRLTGANRFMKLAERPPKKGRREKQGGIALCLRVPPTVTSVTRC